METPIKNTCKNLLLKYGLIILMMILCCSCAAFHHKSQKSSEKNTGIFYGDISKKIEMLRQDLQSLNFEIDATEAKKLAEASISYSLILADEYRLVRPPYLHNILVRIGLKDRGLCYQWAGDLMKRLTILKLKTFSLHQGVAHRGSNFREHNSVIVTAIGQKFNEGIVLDPWRNSGKLYWTKVKSDRYAWEER